MSKEHSRETPPDSITIETREGVTRISLDEVDVTDDFMFSYVMHEPELCKRFLSILLPDMRIRRIEYLADEDAEKAEPGALPQVQKTLGAVAGRRSVRLDVYLENEDAVYNIEMQTISRPAIAQRMRYYQGQIDVGQLQRGHYYDELKPCYIIFICKFDLFEQGEYLYTFENACREVDGLMLQDGAYKLIFNTRGTRGSVSEELCELLQYLNNPRKYAVTEATDPLIREIEEVVKEAKYDEEWRREYMEYTRRQTDARYDGFAQGKAQGIALGKAQGIALGEARGEARGKGEIIQNMLQSGMSVEQIAKWTHMSIEEVRAFRQIH